MPTARIVQTGNGQTVHLPAEVHLKGDEVEVVQTTGDVVELRPANQIEESGSALDLLDLLIELGELIGQAPEDPPPEERRDL